MIKPKFTTGKFTYNGIEYPYYTRKMTKEDIKGYLGEYDENDDNDCTKVYCEALNINQLFYTEDVPNLIKEMPLIMESDIEHELNRDCQIERILPTDPDYKSSTKILKEEKFTPIEEVIKELGTDLEK